MSDSERWAPPWHPDRRTGRFSPRGGRRPSQLFPLPAAILTALLQVASARTAADHLTVYRPMDPVAYALLLAGPVALLWRYRAPIPAFVIAATSSIVFTAQAAPRWMYGAAAGVALFGLARRGMGRASIVCGAAAYGVYLLVTTVLGDRLGVASGARPSLGDGVVLGVGLAVLIFLGGAAKVRSEQMAEMMKVRAERARAKEEQERRQASEERLRIARELHDVLGHHLSLINVQAGVGLHLMDNRPEQAREALTAIKTASSEALREVRAVLGVLRTEDEAAPRQPALGLSRLADLTADAGFPVTTAVSGATRELPAEVDRAAYRIVQEALTNIRKHAEPDATATIAINYLPTALHLAIRNVGSPGEPVVPAPGSSSSLLSLSFPPSLSLPPSLPLSLSSPSPSPSPSPDDSEPQEGNDNDIGSGVGSGIAGMRERAQSLGGRLEAGPVNGGYLVSALLPTPTEGEPA